MDAWPPIPDPHAVAATSAEADAPLPTPQPSEPAPAESLEPVEREVPVEFHGTGSEYFKIWIVNTALTLLTVGIYSAWAKVRSRRYFYGNTRIEGSSFEYLARPRQILLGRIIVGACVVALAIAAQVMPLAYGVLLVAIVLISPWIIVKALRFNARYSAFRNVRFSFHGTAGESYGIYVGLMLLNLITFGLAVPHMEKRARSWLFSGHRYGDQQLRDSLTDSQVYRIYLKTMAVAAIVMIPGFFLFALIAATGSFFGGEGEPRAASLTLFLIVAYALAIVAALLLHSYQWSQLTNLLFNGGRIGQIVGFRSTLRTGPLFRLQLGYALLTLLTLGLAYPWMRIALARYRAQTMVLLMRGTLDQVVGEAVGSGSAIADQLAEGLDIDIDLGL